MYVQPGVDARVNMEESTRMIYKGINIIKVIFGFYLHLVYLLGL